jgi:hypothetical protein
LVIITVGSDQSVLFDDHASGVFPLVF